MKKQIDNNMIELGIIQNCVECVLELEPNTVVSDARTVINTTARTLFVDLATKCGHSRMVLQNHFNRRHRTTIYNLFKNAENFSKYNEPYNRYKSKAIKLLNDVISSNLSRKANDSLVAKILNVPLEANQGE